VLELRNESTLGKLHTETNPYVEANVALVLARSLLDAKGCEL